MARERGRLTPAPDFDAAGESAPEEAAACVEALTVDPMSVASLPGSDPVDAGSHGTRLGWPDRFGRSIMTTYGATVVVGVSTLLVTPLLLHYLGVANFGVWALLTSMATYVSLSDLGISNTTTKFVAETAGKDDAAVITIFNTNFLALCALAVIALGAGLALAVVAPTLFHVPAPDHRSAVVAFAVVAAGVAITLPANTYFGLLIGYQRYDLVGLCNSVTGAAVGLVSACVVLSGGRLVDLAIGFAVTNLITLSLPVILVRRLVPGLRVRRRHVNRASLRRTASLSVWYTVQNLAQVIALEIDLVIVGALIGIKAVGFYAVGAKLGQLADKGVGPLQQVFFPHVSALSIQKDARQRLEAVLIDGTRAVVAVAMPISLVLLFLASPMVHAWVGPGYEVSAQVVMVIGAITAVGSLTTASWQLLAGIGRARLAALIGLGDALLNLGVSVILAGPLGAVGVAVGTLASTLLINLPLVAITTSRLVGVSLVGWVRRSLVSHIAPVAVTALVLAGGARFVSGRPLPVLAAAAGTFLLYEVLFLRFGAAPAERARLTSELAGAGRIGRSVVGKAHRGAWDRQSAPHSGLEGDS